MGCTHGTESDRNKATTKVSVESAIIEAEKAVAFVLKGERSISRIELSISCSHLKNADKLGSSDPFYVAYLRIEEGGMFSEVARSEIIANTLNPQWVNKVILTYNFQDLQILRVDVFDVTSDFRSNDSSNLAVNDQRFLGRCEVPVGTILGNEKLAWFAPLADIKDEEKKGFMTISGEELVSISDTVTMRIECRDLINRGMLGVSNPFLVISKYREDKTYTACYKSEVMMNNLSPTYEIHSSVLEICNGDVQRPLRLELFDWNSSGNHAFIGEVECTLEMLEDSAGDCSDRHPLTLLSGRDTCGKTTGLLFLRSFHIDKNSSFLDYIRGGTQLQFMVAVDYTLSNGEPAAKNSLHAVDQNNFNVLNPYSCAISAVTAILGPYCGGVHDMHCPVFGFGGKLEPGGSVNHCFALNGDESDPYVAGAVGIVDSYYSALKRVTMSGPTIFSSVINRVSRIVQSSMTDDLKSQQYTVLLILTDGCVKDMLESVRLKVSMVPFYVLFIRPKSIDIDIGTKEDFSFMHELDSDDKLLVNRHGESAQRDIVQFTDMSSLMEKSGQLEFKTCVARSLLEELPDQVLAYFKLNDIKPSGELKSKMPLETLPSRVGQNNPSESPQSVTPVFSSSAYFMASQQSDGPHQDLFQLAQPGVSSATVFSVDSIVFGPDSDVLGSPVSGHADSIAMSASARYSEEDLN